MKLIIEVEKDYYEMLKYNVDHGQKYKPFEIIANGITYEERPQGEWIDYDNTFYKCPECGYLLEKCCPQCQNKVILPNGGEL